MIPFIYAEPPRLPALALRWVVNAPASEKSGVVFVYVGDRRLDTSVTARPKAVTVAGSPWSTAAEATSSRPDARHSVVSVRRREERSVEDNVATKLAEIRRLTGWSWERISEALGCSRQAVHGWTLGKEVAPANAELVARLHSAIAYVDRGTSRENSALLATPTGDGRIASDLVAARDFAALRTLLGPGNARRDADREKWSAASYAVLPAAGQWLDSLLATAEVAAPLDQTTPVAPVARRSIKPRRVS